MGAFNWLLSLTGDPWTIRANEFYFHVHGLTSLGELQQRSTASHGDINTQIQNLETLDIEPYGISNNNYYDQRIIFHRYYKARLVL